MQIQRRLCSAILTTACFLLVVGASSAASACPSCQQALAADGGDYARGIYYSILFMLSMPFAIVGAWVGLAYRAVKNEERRVADERRAQEQAYLPEHLRN